MVCYDCKMKPLILASGSAGRKQLLLDIGAQFSVVVSQYEEDMTLDMPPADLALYLSQGKARDVAGREKGAIILGADSFAVCDDKLLGKPHTIERATEMLTMLSGRKHSFVTGFTIIDSDSMHEYSASQTTDVYFRNLSADDIAQYLAREDVMGNAGAYRVQGLGGLLVDKIDGSFSNIVGLPLASVAAAIRDFGINLLV
jgi:septum formation protein